MHRFMITLVFFAAGWLASPDLFGAGWGGSTAWATMQDLKSYKEAYPGKEPKAYTCKVCHDAMMGKADNLNAYGKALQATGVDPKALTAEQIKAIDQDDSDGDTVSNADEIAAGTNPGEAESKPTGTVAP